MKQAVLLSRARTACLMHLGEKKEKRSLQPVLPGEPFSGAEGTSGRQQGKRFSHEKRLSSPERANEGASFACFREPGRFLRSCRTVGRTRVLDQARLVLVRPHLPGAQSGGTSGWHDRDQRPASSRKLSPSRGKVLPQATQSHTQACERRVGLPTVPTCAMTVAAHHPAA